MADIIWNADFKQGVKQQFLLRSIGAKQSRFMELELTRACGNRCSYCGAAPSNDCGELDFSKAVHALEQARNQAVAENRRLLVSLCGGDPVLYSHFHDLTAWMGRQGIHYGIKANPGTLTQELGRQLKENGCAWVRFTLFGDAELHQAHRRGETHEILIQSTHLLRELDMPVAWNLTLGRMNLDATLESLPLVRSMGLTGVTLGRLARIGRLDKESGGGDIEPAAYREFLMAVLAFYQAQGPKAFPLGFKEKLWFPLLVEEGILEFDIRDLSRMVLGCSAQDRCLTLGVDGQWQACGLIPFPVPGAVETPPWTLPGAAGLGFFEEQSECRGCPHYYGCRGCRALALANGNGIHGRDPQCWVENDHGRRPIKGN